MLGSTLKPKQRHVRFMRYAEAPTVDGGSRTLHLALALTPFE
jgi:hypothetical protein